MKDYIPLILLAGIFVLSEIFSPVGTVKVNPLFNYANFLLWYKNTIGDYNPDGTIPDEGEWIDYYATKILKQ